MPVIFLSHFLNNDLTCYNNETNIKITPHKNNELKIELTGHCGTHIDFPFHTDDTGKSLDDYTASHFISYKNYIIEIFPKGNYIYVDDLKGMPVDVEFLIFKTHKFQMRTDSNYAINSVGISEELATFLRQNFKSLKIVGIDSISINAYKDKESGRKAHKIFLNQKPEILIIEDMKLDQVQEGWIEKITIAPLLVKNADGVPVTIIAEFSEKCF